MLGTMALAACQFMEEPGMEVQVRESKHPYNNNTSFEVWLSIRDVVSLFSPTLTKNTFSCLLSEAMSSGLPVFPFSRPSYVNRNQFGSWPRSVCTFLL